MIDIIYADKKDKYFTSDGTQEYNFKEKKEPETWEELKDLCKGLKGVKLFYDNIALVEYIEINNFIAFNENGLMLAMKNNFYVLAKNRTYAQMWNIIKSLTEQK